MRGKSVTPPQTHSLTSQPTALIGMITWAVAYRFRGKASSQAYWIIFLVVWIMNTVVCIMNVYNNISWESDLLFQIAPEYPQGNFWLAALGIRSMCRAKHKHHKDPSMELKQSANIRVWSREYFSKFPSITYCCMRRTIESYEDRARNRGCFLEVARVSERRRVVIPPAWKS